jgi:hypothetical protein
LRNTLLTFRKRRDDDAKEECDRGGNFLFGTHGGFDALAGGICQGESNNPQIRQLFSTSIQAVYDLPGVLR